MTKLTQKRKYATKKCKTLVMAVGGQLPLAQG